MPTVSTASIDSSLKQTIAQWMNSFPFGLEIGCRNDLIASKTMEYAL